MTVYKDLFIAQAGVETTWGCDVAPTLRLMGVETLPVTPIRETEQVKALDGRFSPSKTLVRTKHGGKATLEGLLVYEDSGLWFDGAFGALADTNAKACTTDATGFQRIYNAPLDIYDTDQSAPAFYTLISGDLPAATTDTMAHSLISALVEGFRITGESGAAARIAVDFIGQDVEADLLDASKVDRDTVQYVMGDHWALWIDPDSDAAGTTAIDDLAFKFELDVKTNRIPLYHLGDLTPDSYADAKWEGTLTLTISCGTRVQGYLTSLLTSTPVRKVVRVKATSSSNSITIDFGGALLEAPDLFTDVDGVTTIEMVFQGVYQATLANWLRITTHNGVAAHATMT